jgi:hypothetical protein
MIDSSIFYRSFYEAIKSLPESNQLEVYNAIFEYSFNFVEVELTGLSNTIFTLIKPQLEANNKRYENGNKPKNKQNGSKTEAKDEQKISKVEANKNKNVNNNKNDNVNDNENTCLTFESFWELYDKKVDSKKCKDKFNKVKESDRQKILDTLPTYIKSTPDIKFRKNPSTYLNNECWNDTVEIIESTYPKTIAEEHDENMYKSSLKLVERGMRTNSEHNEVMKTNKMDLKYYLPI